MSGQVPPPVNRMTDRCKNITLAKTSFRPVTKLEFPLGIKNLGILNRLEMASHKILNRLEKSGNLDKCYLLFLVTFK